MIDDSKVTKTNSRILARQLARPLTDDEIDYVGGGMISRAEIGGQLSSHPPCRYVLDHGLPRERQRL